VPEQRDTGDDGRGVARDDRHSGPEDVQDHEAVVAEA
jgi:hypothetical protein